MSMSDDDFQDFLCNESIDINVDTNTTSLMTTHLILTLDESFIARLFELEQRYMLSADYVRGCLDQGPASPRRRCIEWILQAKNFYGFSPVTAVLSVTYCDRYLSSRLNNPIIEDRMYKLLSVVCTRMAAKMEEINVASPTSMFLIFSPMHLFHPETYKEMELLVLKELQWELSCVTPINFLGYFMSKIPHLTANSTRAADVASESARLILETTRISRFLEYAPSIIAAAVVLRAANVPIRMANDLGFYERVDQETVTRCHQEMEANQATVEDGSRKRKRK